MDKNKKTTIDRLTPLHAETYNMAKGLEEDEEEYLLQQNPNLVPLFMVHLDKILQEQKPNSGKKKGKRNEAGREDIELRAWNAGKQTLKTCRPGLRLKRTKSRKKAHE